MDDVITGEARKSSMVVKGGQLPWKANLLGIQMK